MVAWIFASIIHGGKCYLLTAIDISLFIFQLKVNNLTLLVWIGLTDLPNSGGVGGYGDTSGLNSVFTENSSMGFKYERTAWGRKRKGDTFEFIYDTSCIIHSQLFCEHQINMSWFRPENMMRDFCFDLNPSFTTGWRAHFLRMVKVHWTIVKTMRDTIKILCRI